MSSTGQWQFISGHPLPKLPSPSNSTLQAAPQLGMWPWESLHVVYWSLGRSCLIYFCILHMWFCKHSFFEFICIIAISCPKENFSHLSSLFFSCWWAFIVLEHLGRLLGKTQMLLANRVPCILQYQHASLDMSNDTLGTRQFIRVTNFLIEFETYSRIAASCMV